MPPFDFLKSLLNKTSPSESTRIEPSFEKPTNIGHNSGSHPDRKPQPIVCCLNLQGERGYKIIAEDAVAMAQVFGDANVRLAQSIDHLSEKSGQYKILFLYCDLDEQVRVQTKGNPPLRLLIRASGAQIVILASEIPDALMSNPEFQRALSSTKDSSVSLIITLSRHAELFTEFFRKIFIKMLSGMSLPRAWVDLAPQGPGIDHRAPATVMLAAST